MSNSHPVSPSPTPIPTQSHLSHTPVYRGGRDTGQDTENTPSLPFTRCPGCGAVAWPPHPVTHRHRPPCPNQDDNPQTWKATP